MRRGLGAAACLAMAMGSFVACAPTPTAPVSPSGTPSVSVSPSPTPAGQPDFTDPGAAREMVGELLEAADSSTAVLVSVTRTEVRIAVESGGSTETWAYRDGRIGTVASDVEYVDQAAFSPDDFAIDDVGALFRAARAVSGSDTSQELQIVDSSGGEIAMTVSTTPESRTVFFQPDGTLVPTLDLTTKSGITTAFAEAIGERRTASSVVLSSADGVTLDVANHGAGTITRYQRAPRTPLNITTRSEGTDLSPFDPTDIDPTVVWDVLRRAHRAGTYSYADDWSCTVSRSGTSGPLHLDFTLGDESFTTSPDGTRLAA